MRIWILICAIFIVTVLASETFAKKPGKDVDSRGGYEKQKKDVYRSKEQGKSKGHGKNEKVHAQSKKRKSSFSEEKPVENSPENYSEKDVKNQESDKTSKTKNKRTKRQEDVDPRTNDENEQPGIKSPSGVTKTKKKDSNKYSEDSQNSHPTKQSKKLQKEKKNKSKSKAPPKEEQADEIVEVESNLKTEKKGKQKKLEKKVVAAEKNSKKTKNDKKKKHQDALKEEEPEDTENVEEDLMEPTEVEINEPDIKKSVKTKKSKQKTEKLQHKKDRKKREVLEEGNGVEPEENLLAEEEKDVDVDDISEDLRTKSCQRQEDANSDAELDEEALDECNE